MAGLVLFSGLVVAMDGVCVVDTPPDAGRILLLLILGLVGAGIGAAVSEWRGSVLRRWRCVAVGAFAAQALGVLGLALGALVLHVLFSRMYVPW